MRSGVVIVWLNTPFQMQFRVIDGLTVRFAESADRGDHALLLSPWPESLLAFGPMWAHLAGQAHVVAIDLPGFGHSQRNDGLLSPRAMGEFIIRAADAFGLTRPHVIGPGIGTAASLFAAAAHPGRLRSLVVGSGGAAVPLQLGSPLKDWIQAPDLEAFRARATSAAGSGRQGAARHALGSRFDQALHWPRLEHVDCMAVRFFDNRRSGAFAIARWASGRIIPSSEATKCQLGLLA